MLTRKPIVAGQFYPAQHDACAGEINQFLELLPTENDLPESITAAIVPHAGWTFSGQLAAQAFAAIKQQHTKVHCFVIFGAAHSYFSQTPAVFDSGAWTTPLGDITIDEDLAKDVLASGKAISDPQSHQPEHSIEVQVPFIQLLFPGAKILPILTPPAPDAIELGKYVGEIIKAQPDRKIICIGSTDLTHYGPHYGFEPRGSVPAAFTWATDVNDTEFIDRAIKLEPQLMLESAAANHNACGAGAAAAAVSAAKTLGKTKGQLLDHTNSNIIMKQKMNQTSTDSVGYAAMIF